MRILKENCNIRISGFSTTYEEFTLAAYHLKDCLEGIKFRYPSIPIEVGNALNGGYAIVILINGELAVNTDLLKDFDLSQEYLIEIFPAMELEGKALGIVAGVALAATGLAGVGFLGLSATSVGLLGASLLFSSIFNTPKSDTKQKSEKRSINFSGTINTIGTSPCPLLFGCQVGCGSIVVSADISSESRSV